MKTKLVMSENRVELYANSRYIASATGESEVVWNNEPFTPLYTVLMRRDSNHISHACFHVDAVEGFEAGGNE